MDRIHEHSLYAGGGGASVSQAGGGPRSKSPKKKNTSYNPADIDGETSTGIDKFRKANRLLQKELKEVKELLDKEKKLNAKLKKEVESSKFKLI